MDLKPQNLLLTGVKPVLKVGGKYYGDDLLVYKNN